MNTTATRMADPIKKNKWARLNGLTPKSDMTAKIVSIDIRSVGL